jgi:acetyl esterase
MLMDVSTLTLGPRPEVGRVEELVIPRPGGDLRARLTAPAGPGLFAGLVFLHGGGWVTGSIHTHDHLCRSITRDAGAVVVSIDYRLAPEHPFPSAVDDAEAAVIWVAEHAERLGIDPARLGVGGDSAGGNLATAAARRCRDRQAPRLAFQVLLYPVTDAGLDSPSYLENAEGYLLTRSAMAWYWNQYAPGSADRFHPDASPLRAPDLAGLPRALVISAEYDPLRDEAEAYAERLESSGVSVRMTRYPGMIHGFIRRDAILDQGKVALREIAAFVRERTS